ncbi:hypothetical protein BDV33DRAFT_210479 [Aspergillus novoparasiticus]|uniref:Uncharacterized protein n=1 Tax=Aspergillus novoparasiticus TaxID=986946 RepID=A0A5N6E704_9EURO|nr:hypothetical protein BDV33DRAFT_210479 [Aspergillus novoparasiticus]
MRIELYLTRLSVPVALVLAVAWSLPTPVMEANTPNIDASDPTKIAGGILAASLPSPETFSFSPFAEGRGLHGLYHSVLDHERAARIKTVLVQRRQSEDGFVSEPIGGLSTSINPGKSSSSSFSYNDIGNLFVEEKGQLSESAVNAANDIANNAKTDDPGAASVTNPDMSSPTNQFATERKSATDNGDPLLPGASGERARNPTGNEKPPADGYDDRGQYHTKPNGERYHGSKVPDEFWTSGQTWSTAQRQPLDISRKVPSVNENLDHSIQGAIKRLPWPLVKETTPQDRLRSALINNGNFADGYNANMAQNAGSSKNPGNGGIKTQLAPLFKDILTKFTG